MHDSYICVFRHYADWTLGHTAGNASLHVDHRPPNGGGAMTGPSAHCALFDAATLVAPAIGRADRDVTTAGKPRPCTGALTCPTPHQCCGGGAKSTAYCSQTLGGLNMPMYEACVLAVPTPGGEAPGSVPVPGPVNCSARSALGEAACEAAVRQLRHRFCGHLWRIYTLYTTTTTHIASHGTCPALVSMLIGLPFGACNLVVCPMLTSPGRARRRRGQVGIAVRVRLSHRGVLRRQRLSAIAAWRYNTMTATSIWVISQKFLSPLSPHARRVTWST